MKPLKPQTQDLDRIYDDLHTLLKKLSTAGVVAHDKIIGSQASVKKQGYHLYGRKKLSIAGRPLRPTYVFGIIRQKHFVGFYSMPMYSHPNKTKLSPALKRFKKGKSCINLSKLDAKMQAELGTHIKKGLVIYKKLGWI